MRIPARQRTYGSRFNITPLIDIVFLLIIFFLVSSHFVRTESLEPVDLPSASETLDEETLLPRRLVVTVAADGTLFVAGQRIGFDDVSDRITTEAGREPRRVEVRIRGDRRVPYRFIEPLLLDCATAGISNVRFAVVDE